MHAFIMVWGYILQTRDNVGSLQTSRRSHFIHLKFKEILKTNKSDAFSPVIVYLFRLKLHTLLDYTNLKTRQNDFTSFLYISCSITNKHSCFELECSALSLRNVAFQSKTIVLINRFNLVWLFSHDTANTSFNFLLYVPLEKRVSYRINGGV